MPDPNSSLLQVTGSQEPVLFAINADIFDDRNESPMVLFGLADARTENFQQIATENTSCWNGSMDLSRRGETLAARSRGRHSSLACVNKVLSAYVVGCDLPIGAQVLNRTEQMEPTSDRRSPLWAASTTAREASVCQGCWAACPRSLGRRTRRGGHWRWI